MKPPRIPLLAGVLLAAWLLVAGGCSKRAPEEKTPPPKPAVRPVPVPEPAKPSPAIAQPAAKPKPRPAPAPEPPPPPPTPEILFSLRGPESGRLPHDRPLFVAVRVESSVDQEAALTLAPAQGRWSDAVGVELSAAGAPDKVLLRAWRIADGAGAAAATLGTTGQAADGTWLFPSDQILQLSPGDYRVQVKLAIADGPGWHGTVAGEAADVTLVAAGASATPEEQVKRALALAGEAMLAKDGPKAAQLLDERLAADPDHIELLQARALLCLQGGNLIAANACVSRAWARVMRENWTHPPADLYALNQAVMAGFSKPPESAASEPLPAWSIPPAAVLAPLPGTKPPAGK